MSSIRNLIIQKLVALRDSRPFGIHAPLRTFLALIIALVLGARLGFVSGILSFIFFIFWFYELRTTILKIIIIVLFISCLFTVSLIDNILAEQIATYIYYFFIVTVVLYFIEYFKYPDQFNSNNNDTSSSPGINFDSKIPSIFERCISYINTHLEFVYFIGVSFMITAPFFFHRGYLFLPDTIWGPNMLVGFDQRFLIINFISNIFSNFGIGDIFQKIFLTTIIIVLLWGGYRLSSVFINKQSRFIAFAGSLFVLFNPFVYDRMLYGQWGIPLSLGCVCIGLSFFIEWMREVKLIKKTRYAFTFFGIAVLTTPQSLFFIFILIIPIILIIYFKNIKRLQSPELRTNLLTFILKQILVGIFILLIINCVWIIDLSQSLKTFGGSQVTQLDYEAFKTSGNTPGEAMKNVILLSGFWGKDQHRYIDITQIKYFWGRAFAITGTIMLYGLLTLFIDRRKRYLGIGISIILFICILLALGLASGLTSNLTLWLHSYFPFYDILRETGKWVFVIVILYLFLLLYGIDCIKQKLSHEEISYKILKIILTISIIMQAPFLFWGFSRQVKPVMYPSDWQAVDSILQSTNCDGSTLVLPWHLYIKINWVDNIVSNPAKVFFKCPVIVSSNPEWKGSGYTKDDYSEKIPNWISSHGNIQALKEIDSKIGYIILLKEADWILNSWISEKQGVDKVYEGDNILLYKVNN